MAGYDLVTFTGAPPATSPFFMGESLDGARIALRCDNPLIQLRAAANDVGIAELTCFLGDSSPDLIRVWPHEAPARRTAWLIMHSDMRRSARIRAVAAAIGDAFRCQRKILAGNPWQVSANAVSLGGRVALSRSATGEVLSLLNTNTDETPRRPKWIQ